MIDVFLEKWIHERKPLSFSLLRFLEISGLLTGIVCMVVLKLIILPLFLETSADPLGALLLLIMTAVIGIFLSFGTVFLHTPFFKFFCIGNQVFVLAKTFYNLLSLGFSTVFLQGFAGNSMFVITVISLLLFRGIRFLWETALDLKVQQIPGIYAVSKFPADEHFSGKFNDSPESFFASTRTVNELSVITESKIFLRNYPLQDELLLFEFVNSNVNGTPHRLFSKVLFALDKVSIPYFSLATFEKNYVLFKSSHLLMAKYTWHSSGIKVNTYE